MPIDAAACAAPVGQPERPMVDLAFALAGDRLPSAYAFPLEAALVDALPWLGEDEACGIHPIRAPLTADGLILSRRSRLILRLPADRADDARRLTGRRLPVGDVALTIGIPSLRPLTPFATLQARNVATAARDEQGFVADIVGQLDRLGARARLICGRAATLDDGARQIRGFGLVLYELSPAHSLLLQARGLGFARRLGCGVFVHHKIIAGLGGEAA
ncbi:MAG: type I-MYXAN CRISPR-associated protein Cas6/Cmx6 [Azonexus sp.]|jgi:CRISPR-associated protein Cas6|nr:type I-MYXAN CRISPR-associated protein Cas6/Cmx6 [Azonexus sp.]